MSELRINALVPEDPYADDATVEELQIAIDNSMTGISWLDADGVFRKVREGYSRMLGYDDPEDLVGQSWTVTVVEEDLGPGTDTYKEMLKAGRATAEIRALRKDGSVFIKQLLLVKTLDEKNQHNGHYCFMRDVTEQKQAEHRNAQTERLNTVGILASGIAHDLNNLLTPILGYAEMIEAGCDDTPGAAKDIAEAAKRAQELIAQILDFSKDVSPDTSTFHMAQVVRNALQFVQGSLPANVKVETKLDADPDTVCAIEGKMQLMVMNLLSNAGDAMEEEGGVLNVELKSVSEGVQLIVSDTGPGIPDKVLSRIFEPFFTTKPLGRGSGLGLPMVREAVEEAGGTLDLVSRPGDGTTFTILLPASEKTASSEPKEKSNCGPLKILVVDDEPQVLTVTGKMLLHLGHEPICFGSSAEALAYDGKYDLVLTDYHIDGSSGVELAEQLKDFDGPVILVTGNYDSQQELPPRISSKINKPFTLKTLRETLASVTGQ